jgi:methionine-rich copper-binding protein CopC
MIRIQRRALRNRIFVGSVTILAATSWLCSADADQLHVRESNPAAEAIIHGRHAEYVVRFDGPVDHAASHIQITQSGRVVQTLSPLLDSAVDVLFASGEAPPAGHYLLHWETRSPLDGEVSRGDIPFSVAP